MACSIVAQRLAKQCDCTSCAVACGRGPLCPVPTKTNVCSLWALVSVCRPLPGSCSHSCMLLCHPGPCPPCPLLKPVASCCCTHPNLLPCLPTPHVGCMPAYVCRPLPCLHEWLLCHPGPCLPLHKPLSSCCVPLLSTRCLHLLAPPRLLHVCLLLCTGPSHVPAAVPACSAQAVPVRALPAVAQAQFKLLLFVPTMYTILPHPSSTPCMFFVCRPLPGSCSHSCMLLCHPGPCPPCPLLVDASCFCGKAQMKQRCGNNEFSCR